MNFIFILSEKEKAILTELGYSRVLKSKNHEVFFRVIPRSKGSKNVDSLGAIDRFARFLYFIEKSKLSYSYYHAIFERFSIRKILNSILIQIVGRILRKNSDLTKFLRVFTENIREKVFTRTVKFDEPKSMYVFFNIMGSKLELDNFYSCVKVGIDRVLVQTYWDNITSKIYVPTAGFTSVVCWGPESEDLYALLNGGATKRFSAFPFRCFYLRDVNFKGKSRVFLYAPTQKHIENDLLNLRSLNDYVEEEGGGDFTIIYRPHPFSNPKKLPNLQTFRHVKLDEAFESFRTSDAATFEEIPGFSSLASSSLSGYLGDAACVISQAGTMCLEARFLSIAVIVLLNEPYQVTLKMSHSMTHFCDLFTDPGVHPVFTQKQLRYLLDMQIWSQRLAPSNFVVSSLTTEQELHDVLNFLSLN